MDAPETEVIRRGDSFRLLPPELYDPAMSEPLRASVGAEQVLRQGMEAALAGWSIALTVPADTDPEEAFALAKHFADQDIGVRVSRVGRTLMFEPDE
jgi:hypothetical protein